MHYTQAMRGRWLVAIGAIVIIGSSLVQWWQIGGGIGELPAQGGTGISDGRVFLLMFLPSIACLLLVALPFASEKPISIDHPVAYLSLTAAVAVGYIWRVVSLAQIYLVPWPPQRGIGFWIAAVGLLLMARGAFETFEERRRRLY